MSPLGTHVTLVHYVPVQTIPVHINTARDNAERFHELAREVEVFPRKVAAALRIKAEPSGFFESIWTGIEEYVLSWLKVHA